MGLSSKFLLILIVCVAFQTIQAWPQFNIFQWQNIEYDIKKAANDAERDLKKDVLNVKNKAWKELSKLMKKVRGSDQIVTCMMKAHQDVLTMMDKRALDAIACIDEVRKQVNEVDERKFSPSELRSIKSRLKNEAKACRTSAKDELKRYQDGFSSNAEQCFVIQNKPSE